MSIVSQLVLDRETGKLCIMIKLGSETAVQELPDHLATATREELKAFMDSVVPEMVNGLRAKRQAKSKKLQKKAKNA